VNYAERSEAFRARAAALEVAVRKETQITSAIKLGLLVCNAIAFAVFWSNLTVKTLVVIEVSVIVAAMIASRIVMATFVRPTLARINAEFPPPPPRL
jgi:hypothetical protein